MKITGMQRMLAVAVVAAGVGIVVPAAHAADPSRAAAASADAYALEVDVNLVAGNVPVAAGPFAQATQDYPTGAAAPAEATEISTGQIPAGGTLVDQVAVLSSMAGATGEPKAVASSQATDVRLLNQGAGPLITAQLIRAQSNTSCTGTPNSEGTDFVNLNIAGVQDPIPSPEPNTVVASPVLDLLGIRVVLNEQHPTADGRGLVVNAIHIYSVEPSPTLPLFDGDIVVAHAMSTVNCPNGAPSTGLQGDIVIVKDANKTQARPGESVTYTATVRNNNADTPCAVNRFVDHLPTAFDFVSTSGAFGTVAELVERPGGGVDAVLKPADLTIAPKGSATQTFVLKVKSNAAPGVYFNNVELFCGNLGNFVKGLDAPVEVPGARLPQCSDTIDNDGDGKIDFPNDPGCDSPQDDDERDQPRQLPRTGAEQSLMWLLGGVLLLSAVAVRKLRSAL